MCDRNVKSEYILIELCALVFEYICERTTKFHEKILFDSRVINIQIPIIMHQSDCSCAPILQFFDAALDGATANRQIPDRIFGQFFYQFEEG